MKATLCASVIMAAIGAACLGSAVQAAELETIGIAAFRATGEAKQYGTETVVWNGTFVGASTMHGAKGPLHRSGWECTGEVVIALGTVHTASGFCSVTDPDGDVLNLLWERTDTPAPVEISDVRTKGTYLSGTGKYAGIEGFYTFTCHTGIATFDICEVNSEEYRVP